MVCCDVCCTWGCHSKKYDFSNFMIGTIGNALLQVLISCRIVLMNLRILPGGPRAATNRSRNPDNFSDVVKEKVSARSFDIFIFSFCLATWSSRLLTRCNAGTDDFFFLFLKAFLVFCHIFLCQFMFLPSHLLVIHIFSFQWIFHPTGLDHHSAVICLDVGPVVPGTFGFLQHEHVCPCLISLLIAVQRFDR